MRGFLRHGVLLGVLLGLTACAGGQSTQYPGMWDTNTRVEKVFSRFDHGKHDDVLVARGWTCLACHAVGAHPEREDGKLALVASDDPSRTVLRPPAQTCHGCHRNEAEEAAPSRCNICHEGEILPPPDSHGAGWIEDHRSQAPTAFAECSNCHTDYYCVQCHVRRNRIDQDVHKGNWLTLHGMAARADPVSCEGCHEGGTCLQCHLEPDGRQGW